VSSVWLRRVWVDEAGSREGSDRQPGPCVDEPHTHTSRIAYGAAPAQFTTALGMRPRHLTMVIRNGHSYGLEMNLLN